MVDEVKKGQKPVEFIAEVRSITTGRKLGQDAGLTVTVRVQLEGNASEIPLDMLAKLQRGGPLRVTLDLLQLEL